MGTRQTKGSLAERASPGAAPGPRRERPDFWASLLLRAGDKAGRAGAGLPPYHRRVGMVQELLRMVRQGRREEAGTLLQHLRQELQESARRSALGLFLALGLAHWLGTDFADLTSPLCFGAALRPVLQRGDWTGVLPDCGAAGPVLARPPPQQCGLDMGSCFSPLQ
ncbi:hypothetical protein MC885_014292 [Smutsia gigantea]|nr:hypothetical protein MC885_014292 [Smutsia gigantea]